MPNYKLLYFTLFKALSMAIERIEEKDYDGARELLLNANRLAEEIHIETDTAESD